MTDPPGWAGTASDLAGTMRMGDKSPSRVSRTRGDRSRLKTMIETTRETAERRVRDLVELRAITPRLPSRRDSVRRRGLAAADVVALSLSCAVAWAIVPPSAPLASYCILLLALPGWVVLNKLLGLYDRDANLISSSALDELPRLLISVLLGSTLVFFLAPLIPETFSHRRQTVVFALAALILLPSLRSLARRLVTWRFPSERCVIVGSDSVSRLLTEKLRRHKRHPIDIVGYVDGDGSSRNGGISEELPRLGTLESFGALCVEHDVDRVIVAFSNDSHERLLETVRTAKQLRLKVTIVPRLFEAFGHSLEAEQVEGMTLLALRAFSHTRSTLAFKRAIDIFGAGLGLILLSPLLATVAAGIALTSRGPTLYRQRRIGLRGRTFTLLKFRTMIDGADALKPDLAHLNEAASPMFKIADDPRVTPFGRWLRRTSIDELPQLWNVVRGEMSLVGPRPLVPQEADQVIGWHRARLSITPGLTGPWQVMGRNAIPFQEMVALDYLYVADWSLWNDVKLLIQTAPVIFRARGA